MQFYRDAIQAFGADEVSLMMWHKRTHDSADDRELLAAALPSSYMPMENSATGKDVEYGLHRENDYTKEMECPPGEKFGQSNDLKYLQVASQTTADTTTVREREQSGEMKWHRATHWKMQ